MEPVYRPAEPRIPFDLGDIKKKEVDNFVKKARAKSVPGNDKVCYKVYNKCPRLRTLIRDMWRTKDVAKRHLVNSSRELSTKREDAKELG